jgi:hypothetical protein
MMPMLVYLPNEKVMFMRNVIMPFFWVRRLNFA